MQVIALTDLPRLPTGKPDYRRARGTGRPDRITATALPGPPATGGEARRAAQLRAAFGAVLGRDDVGDADSFVVSAGDSLSYVEVSMRVEDVLGSLPAGWHTLTIAELAGRHAPERRAVARWRPTCCCGRSRS